MCYARYEKPLKKPLFRSGQKKKVETYSSSNAAADDPEERVEFRKLRHYTNAKEKEKKNEEDD